MPITNQLLREGRVFLSTYGETFTTPEVTQMVNSFQQEILDHAAKKVHNISDFTAVKKLPPDSLGSSLQMMKRSHPMLGAVILVTPNEFIHKLIDIFAKLSRSSKVIFARSIEDALAEADKLLAAELVEEAAKNPVTDVK